MLSARIRRQSLNYCSKVWIPTRCLRGRVRYEIVKEEPLETPKTSSSLSLRDDRQVQKQLPQPKKHTSISHQVLSGEDDDFFEVPSVTESRLKHVMFDDPKEKRLPPYVKDRSIQSASINKELFRRYKETKFHETWPAIQAEKNARRRLPIPISLTGLGLDDGSSAKYWTVKLRRSFEKIDRLAEAEEVVSDNFLENVPPSVSLVLNSVDSLSQDHEELKKIYLDSLKEEEKRLEQKKKDEKDMKIVYQFPHSIRQKIRERVDKEVLEFVQETRKEVLDKEFVEYERHRKVLDFMAKGFAGDTSRTVDERIGEMEGWKEMFWRRSYGSPNPSIAPSRVPCGGCGARMHCTDPGIPGYLPSEKFINLTDQQLHHEKCQRCQFMDHFNVSLDVTVDPDQYPNILAEIQANHSIVILMVDLLDFPCSIWPDVVHLLGKNRKFFVVGNKVDLLPRDDKWYLDRVRESLKKSLFHAGISREFKSNVHNISLISAKTGHGVEELVTRLFHAWNGKEDIYLIGCTNVGKSTLFNTLMQSDLCALRENDLVQRATTSVWPGTTLNLLKFPFRKLEGWQMTQRLLRLRWYDRVKAQEHELRHDLYKQTGQNPGIAQLTDRVDMTFRQEVPFTIESGHPFARRHEVKKPFSDEDPAFRDCRFVYDSPGTVYKDQILDLLTTDELLKVIPRRLITPRTFSLLPYQTLFVGGLARLDVVHSRQNVLLTVFASEYIPIHVVHTSEARRFYDLFLGSQLLGAPIGPPDRLSHWPDLVPKEIDVKGVNWIESCMDIVLSSAGWVAVTIGPEEEAVVKAYTPDGRGCFVRRPSMLPFAVRLKGRRIRDTPCFEVRRVELEDFVEAEDDQFERYRMEERRDRRRSFNAFRMRD